MWQRQSSGVTPCYIRPCAVNLKDFVGKVGVYGDVNDSLTASMGAYARFVEENDLEEIQRVRAEGRKHAAESMEEMWATYDVSCASPGSPHSRACCTFPSSFWRMTTGAA